MRRRDLMVGLGSAAAAWPLAARAQQAALPVVGFINGSMAETSARYGAAFRSGLGETGYVEGRNVYVEYYWLAGQYDQIQPLVAEMVRRRVAVIATPGFAAAAHVAKTMTATIPIVSGFGDDPVRLGLVASLARPGGNITGINYFAQEAVPKRVGLLHELVPRAARLAVLVNPQDNSGTEATLRQVQDAAGRIGLPIDVLKASTGQEIEDAFAMLVREPAEPLLISANAYFGSRRVQFATLAARYGIAAAYFNRDFVEAGGLMSYGTDVADMFRQVGDYTGQILKGAKPADLPVVQSIKFEFAINMQTARALRIEVPPEILASADVVIE